MRLLLLPLLLLGPPAEAGLLDWCKGVWAGVQRERTVLNVSRVKTGDPLGSGSQAIVFLGEGKIGWQKTPLPVVVKEFRPEVPTAAGRAAARRAAQREADAYRLVHPGAAKILEQGGKIYLVQGIFPAALETPGKPAVDLKGFLGVHTDRIGDRAFWHRVTDAALVDLEGIHARGLVHRDVKPENLLVSKEGRARLIDFGLAEKAGADVAGTRGTLTYISPGLWLGNRKVEARDDVFALGLTLLQAETGSRIAESGDRILRLYKQLPFAALSKLPEGHPNVTSERAMAHLSYVKHSVADYRKLLEAAESPEKFAEVYGELWLKSYNAEKNEGIRDYLVYELYLAPELGPKLLKAIPDEAVRNQVIARGKEMRPRVKENRLLAPWVSWHKGMETQIDTFIANYER